MQTGFLPTDSAAIPLRSRSLGTQRLLTGGGQLDAAQLNRYRKRGTVRMNPNQPFPFQKPQVFFKIGIRTPMPQIALDGATQCWVNDPLADAYQTAFLLADPLQVTQHIQDADGQIR